ncbi:DUF2179 domain-containing protein [Aequorivita sp. H23M31]|uniref:UPF0316 protein EI546_14325 n=1 Tax=Aequorivita ciconiae TaxID=2494375 RepID=A0A410G6B2_9FLAO|nr:DUF5698 domain-containing protein [Aequorivita sp. H23M31]QAA82819.1 DUF2179 domain-containing protein [Aequorivita sp. H23M31]
MQEFFTNLGFSSTLFSYVILPLLIFFARVCDVTLSTIRIIFVMNGKRNIAPILGFFEAFIWLLAIGQIITQVDNIFAYLAYAGGFATGTYIGMYVEERLAVGMAVLRLITKEINEGMLEFLHENKFSYSLVDGMGRKGKVNVVFFVVKRENLERLIEGINEHHPNAFYTIENIRQVNEGHQFNSPINTGENARRWQLKRR